MVLEMRSPRYAEVDWVGCTLVEVLSFKGCGWPSILWAILIVVWTSWSRLVRAHNRREWGDLEWWVAVVVVVDGLTGVSEFWCCALPVQYVLYSSRVMLHIAWKYACMKVCCNELLSCDWHSHDRDGSRNVPQTETNFERDSRPGTQSLSTTDLTPIHRRSHQHWAKMMIKVKVGPTSHRHQAA